MRSPKSRSRSKSNRTRSVGNIVNRVFDSSGPEGKVRGTPQQVIDKYNQLARDAQVSNDRIGAENFLQHAEHYTRLLNSALQEMEARREQHTQSAGEAEGRRGGQGDSAEPAAGGESGGRGDAADQSGPDAATADDGNDTMVQTPEGGGDKRGRSGGGARRGGRGRAAKGAGGAGPDDDGARTGGSGETGDAGARAQDASGDGASGDDDAAAGDKSSRAATG